MNSYKLVHCKWDAWEVGECSVTCGGGNRTKTRTEKVSSSFGGEECEGLSSITETCNVQECPGTITVELSGKIVFL